MIRQMMKKTLLFLCVFMLGATGALAAYPDHPITLVVPFGAGGGTDIPARLLAGMMEKRLGQPIVVQNVSGAGGTLGVAQVAAAKPDGYTLGYVPTGTMCLQPHVMKLPYGTDAFDFIGTSVSQPVVLMTAQNAPWKNINEFIEMAKKNPNKYVVGITATGNMTHVPMLQFAEHFGLKLRFIPYRSGGEIFKDIMAGRTHLHADVPASLSTFDVYGLVQFADERSENLSDIPTTKELGMDARFSHWQGRHRAARHGRARLGPADSAGCRRRRTGSPHLLHYRRRRVCACLVGDGSRGPFQPQSDHHCAEQRHSGIREVFRKAPLRQEQHFGGHLSHRSCGARPGLRASGHPRRTCRRTAARP